MILLKDNKFEKVEVANHDELEFMTALSELSLKALIEKRNVLVFPNSFQAGDMYCQ